MEKKRVYKAEEQGSYPVITVMQPTVVNVSSENMASEGLGVSRDPDDVDNVYPGERVIGAFDFDNREDGK